MSPSIADVRSGRFCDCQTQADDVVLHYATHARGTRHWLKHNAVRCACQERPKMETCSIPVFKHRLYFILLSTTKEKTVFAMRYAHCALLGHGYSSFRRAVELPGR